MMLVQSISIFILVNAVLGVAKSGEGDPLVKAPAGNFRGTTLTSFSGAHYAAFRGIPYGLPPVGKRRFAKPEAFPKIKGVFDATDFGPACLQVAGVESQEEGEEDCLYLNIYTSLREEITSEADGKLRKVLVFVPGGALIFGSSTMYLPGDFVTRADVVVVTMNYRLGWLGFMRGNSDTLSGNQGLWDVLLSLKWVKDNIRAFGGDPDDITLGGETAGSGVVGLMSMSPLTKNLFTKAIMFGMVPMFFTPSHSSNDLIKMAASKLGCDADPEIGNLHELISCLRELPAKVFGIEKFAFKLMRTLPSSGDELLPRPIPQLMKDEDYLSEIGFFSKTYTVCATKHSGVIITQSHSSKVSTENISSTVQGVVRHLSIPKPVANALVQEYSKHYDALAELAIALFTDAEFTDAAEMFGKLRQQGKSPRNNVYFLSFDHSPKYMPHSYAVNGLDVMYIFDFLPTVIVPAFYPFELNGDFMDEDWQLKSDYIDLIKVFMETGTPGENFTRELDGMTGERPYISFSLQPSVGQEILGDRWRIWQELFPKWMEEHQPKEKEPKQEL